MPKHLMARMRAPPMVCVPAAATQTRDMESR